MTEFNDKVAVITGAGSGIGRALAQELARQGCRLALSDISQDGLAQTVDLLGLGPERLHCELLNVADRAAFKAYAATVVAHFGQVDIVINNAGVGLMGSVSEVSDEDFDWLMGINFWGMVDGSRAFLPHLQTRPQAWLVNVSSIFGIIGVPGQAAYNASKFGVRGFTEALWHEYNDSNITVCCVHPGGIKTAIARNSRASASIEPHQHSAGAELFEQMARTTPEQAAVVIVEGMRKHRRRILIGGDAKFMALLTRLMPDNYWRVLERFLSRKPAE